MICCFKIMNVCIFFSIWVFAHDHSRITGLQGKGEGISLTPHYHFHPLHRHFDISRAITAESSPLHIASSILQICTFVFLFSCKTLAYDLLFQNYERLHFKHLLLSCSKPIITNLRITHNISKTRISDVKLLSTPPHFSI